MNIKLRRAEEKDMDAVHRMVKQLALFEKAPDEVITTPETFRRDGFTENRFLVILAEDQDNLTEPVIGIALCYWAYSSWKGKFLWLEDLVIDDVYRRQGVGLLLFEAVMQEALENGAMTLKWQVLDWNEPAIKFYQQLHAEWDKEWLNYRLRRKDMEMYFDKK